MASKLPCYVERIDLVTGEIGSDVGHVAPYTGRFTRRAILNKISRVVSESDVWAVIRVHLVDCPPVDIRKAADYDAHFDANPAKRAAVVGLASLLRGRAFSTDASASGAVAHVYSVSAERMACEHRPHSPDTVTVVAADGSAYASHDGMSDERYLTLDALLADYSIAESELTPSGCWV